MKTTMKTRSPWVRAGVVSSSGVEFVAAVAISAWLGKLADERLGTSPLFVLAGFLFGIILGFYTLMKTLKKLERMDADVSSDKSKSS